MKLEITNKEASIYGFPPTEVEHEIGHIDIRYEMSRCPFNDGSGSDVCGTTPKLHLFIHSGGNKFWFTGFNIPPFLLTLLTLPTLLPCLKHDEAGTYFSFHEHRIQLYHCLRKPDKE